jgi:hypothetical protein
VETENEKRLSDVIRDVIRTIPSQELPYAKPARVLPGVEKAGFEITPSVRATVSKILKKMKEADNPQVNRGNIVEFPESALPHLVADRTELALKLVEACGGDCSLAKAEIDRLARIAKVVKDA